MKEYIYSVGETVFESFYFGCLILDVKGRVIFSNKAFAGMLNWSVEEIKGFSIDDLISEDEKKQTHKVISDFLVKGIPLPENWTFYSRLNKPVLVSVDAKPVAIENKIYICLIVKNITEKINLERTIKKKKKELNDVLRLSNLAIKTARLGVWKYITKTKELLWNDVMYDIYEVEPANFNGWISDFNRFTHPDDIDIALRDMKRALKGENVYDSMFRIITDKNNLRYISASGAPVFDKNGDIEEVIGVNIDITELKENEQELRKHREQIQSITDSIPGLVLQHVLHPDGTDEAIYISQRVRSFFGFDPKNVLKDFSLVWKQVLPCDIKDLKISIIKSARSLSFWDHKFRVKDRNNRIIWLRGMGTPKLLENEDVEWNSIFLDITKREEYRINLEASLEEREILLQEIHHRVKNNLAIICGLIELQIMDSGDTSGNHLKDARNRINTIALVHEQLYSGTTFSHINMESYLKDLFNNLIKTTIDSNSKITFDYKFEIDSLNINQAIPLGLLTSELFTNSVKHAFCGTDDYIKFHMSKNDGLIRIFYKDSGKGYCISNKRNNSLGNELIITLLEQLNAEYSLITEGTFELYFSFVEKTKGAHSNIAETELM